MVVQAKFASKHKFSTQALDNPSTIQTAGAGQTIKINRMTNQRIVIFNHPSMEYDAIATFCFEVAPISIPLILGLPFFEAMGDFIAKMFARPNSLLFHIRRQFFHITAVHNPAHDTDPTSFTRSCHTYQTRYGDPLVPRPKQQCLQTISAVTLKHFNKELLRDKYNSVYKIFVNPLNNAARAYFAGTPRANNTPDPPDEAKWPDFLDQVIRPYLDSLFNAPSNLPPLRGEDDFAIETDPNAPPVFQNVRPLDQAQLLEMKTQLEALLKKGWIQPSKSPWGASVVFATKKNGGIRIC